MTYRVSMAGTSGREKNDNLDELAGAAGVFMPNTRTNWMNCTGWAFLAENLAKNHQTRN